MKYRRFGSLEWEASILGLGVSKLPARADHQTLIDEASSIELIRYAVDRGISYLDLGYRYDLSRQERLACLVREALENGYSEKIKIAVAIPADLIDSRSDLELYLNRQLNWLKTDKIDLCLLGRLNRENWPVLLECGALNWIEGAVGEGRVQNMGFSFHDHYQVLKAILESSDRWTFCQFQFSYMDIDHDPGISGIRYAAEKGLAIVVKEPLKSGRLAQKPPEHVAEVWADARGTDSYMEWGLRFVWDYPEVTTVIRDMNSIFEVAQSVAVADITEPGSLSVQEEIVLSRVRDAYQDMRPIPCASCRPCMPCPEEIDVPRIFEIYNDAHIYGDMKTAYSTYIDERHHIENCIQCRLCEERCVKRLPIVEWLKRISEFWR